MSALFVLREVERCHGAAPDLRRGASDRRDPWYGREVKGGRPPYDNSVNRGPVDQPAPTIRSKNNDEHLAVSAMPWFLVQTTCLQAGRPHRNDDGGGGGGGSHRHTERGQGNSPPRPPRKSVRRCPDRGTVVTLPSWRSLEGVRFPPAGRLARLLRMLSLLSSFLHISPRGSR